VGRTPNHDIGTLAARDWAVLPRPTRVVGVNVAGEATRVRIEAQMTRWRLQPEWQHASEQACGVRNGYNRPSQLGADRWAALIAARRRATRDDLFPSPSVVVNAGTAVTIDAMDADGMFRGGLICAGLNLMLQALAHNTAAMKIAPGDFQPFPRSTADALYTGAVLAIAGAVEQMRQRLHPGLPPPRCYVSGDAAPEILPRLVEPVEYVEHLVLEGVVALAEGD
jgi:type III pantothenate kinase